MDSHAKPWMSALTTLITTANRRWLTAIGGGVLVLLTLAPRRCGQHETPIALTVAAHDAADRTLEAKIRAQEKLAQAGQKAESTSVARKNQLETAWRASSRVVRDSVPLAPESPAVDSIFAAGDSALAAADVQITALTTALQLSETRAKASDSVLHVLSAEMRRTCRLLWVVPCPSRTTAAVLGTAAGAGTVVIALVGLRR